MVSSILRTWACASLPFTPLATSSPTVPESERVAIKHEKKSEGNNEYDYIIVGVSVLVLEHGIIDRSNTTQMPLMATTLNTGAMFNITSAPEPGLENRQYAIRAGSIAGGGSSVNGALIIS
ncbi:hypothetical protein FQN51_001859 [Onygenales sp. PD_10]|nr:hypothetical protein FQN51_001859 [Onygenales sp. PD_10]